MRREYLFSSIARNQTCLLLGVILILFLVTRLYKIGDIPSSVYWDEASIGYNAYSIAQTGKDEWGVNNPLHFKAFGEYKLPLYIYSAVLPVKIFGLNALSVRLPSVVFSLINILLVYFIARKISGKPLIGLLSAFFLSVSPYMFIFSRTGFEAVAGLTFFLSGVLCFLLAWKKPWLFILTGLSLALSMYAYNGYRILAPLTLVILIFYMIKVFRQRTLLITAVLITTALVFFAASFPITNFLLTDGSVSRYQAIGIERLDRKKVFIGLDIVRNYISHFNPDYLFINGDKNSRAQLPGFGQLVIFDAVLVLFGLIFLRRQPNRLKWPLIFVLLGIIPASVTRESPHALRSLAAAPFISILTAYGVIYLQEKFSANRENLLKLVVAVYLGFFIVYFNNFINVYSAGSSKDWQEEYKIAFQTYSGEFDNYDHILMSDRYSQPYIFALYYLKYDPDSFRKSAVFSTGISQATSRVAGFDKLVFKTIDYYQLPKGKNLIFSHPTDMLNELPVKNILYRSDGSVAFYVYEYVN